MLHLYKQARASREDLLEPVRGAKSLLKLMTFDNDVSQRLLALLDTVDTVISEADDVGASLRKDLSPTVNDLTTLCSEVFSDQRSSIKTRLAMETAFYDMCSDLCRFVHGTPVSTKLTMLPHLFLIISMSPVEATAIKDSFASYRGARFGKCRTRKACA